MENKRRLKKAMPQIMRSDKIDFTTIYGSSNPIYRWLTSRFRSTVDRIVSPLLEDGQWILDVGCGEGFVVRYLLKRHRNLRLAALDFDMKRIRITKHLSPNVRAIEGDVYELPFSSCAFDIVLVNEILEHLEKPQWALKQIDRVANKYIVFSVPNEPIFSIGNLIRGAYWSRLGRTPTHVNFWTRKAFIALLAQYFEVIAIRTCLPWIFVLCKVHRGKKALELQTREAEKK